MVVRAVEALRQITVQAYQNDNSYSEKNGLTPEFETMSFILHLFVLKNNYFKRVKRNSQDGNKHVKGYGYVVESPLFLFKNHLPLWVVTLLKMQDQVRQVNAQCEGKDDG